MEVKSIFLNGVIKEEVYVKQLKSFEEAYFRNHVM